MELSESWRLELLRHLDGMLDVWLTPEMIAALEPMDNKGEKLAAEIRKVGQKVGQMKALDVCADTFVAFASLNPSLIEVLKMGPSYRYRYQEAAQ
jgi:hypothetical protein